MNTSKTFSSEDNKTILTTSLTGAAFGLLYGYDLKFGILIGLMVGAALGAAVGVRISRKPPKMRYPLILMRRMLFAAAYMLVTTFGYSYLHDQNLTNTQELWSSLLPLTGWIALVISLGLAIASLDELQRRIQTEAIAIGFAGTSIFVVGYALLQYAGLAKVNVGIVIVAMAVFWLLGKFWTIWKY